jgi:hypothetical protein
MVRPVAAFLLNGASVPAPARLPRVPAVYRTRRPFECVGVDCFILRDGLVVENRIISEVFRLLAQTSGRG